MIDLISTIEAVLFAAGEPVSIDRLSLVLGVSEKDISLAGTELSEIYAGSGRGIRVIRLGDKFQMCSAPEFAGIITKVLEQRKPAMLSQPALETLAIVAYFQPVTRAYIDQIRGVDSSYTVGILQERGLIEPCGKLDVPGRPSLFKTTDAFLRTMGISSTEELPELPDMKENENIEKLRQKIDELTSGEIANQISLSEVTGKQNGSGE